MREFYLNFAEFAMQLENKKARNRVKTVIQVASSSIFDPGELRLPVKEVEDCRRVLENSKGAALAAEGFAKLAVRTGSGPSMSGGTIYQKVVLAALRRQMMTCLS